MATTSKKPASKPAVKKPVPQKPAAKAVKPAVKAAAKTKPVAKVSQPANVPKSKNTAKQTATKSSAIVYVPPVTAKSKAKKPYRFEIFPRSSILNRDWYVRIANASNKSVSKTAVSESYPNISGAKRCVQGMVDGFGIGTARVDVVDVGGKVQESLVFAVGQKPIKAETPSKTAPS